jgi:hypothetical protein
MGLLYLFTIYDGICVISEEMDLGTPNGISVCSVIQFNPSQ